MSVVAFLSIDLDYWSHVSNPNYAKRFFRRLLRNFGRPIMVALHHHLLAHVNNRGRGFNTLINIDYHSDLNSGPDGEFTEANWVNYVNFREKGTFIWRYPDGRCLSSHTGYCHSGDNPFESDCSGWARVKMRHGLARIPWNCVREIGVCLSPGWLNDNQRGVSFPIEAFNLFNWLGRWTAYNGLPGSVHRDMEDGVGIYRPRLTRVNRDLCLS